MSKPRVTTDEQDKQFDWGPFCVYVQLSLLAVFLVALFKHRGLE